MKISSTFLSLHNRYLHFLWKKTRKRKVIIAGKEITYVVLYKWLLFGGPDAKKTFVDAMRLVHRPTKTAMIFVTDSELSNKWLRYTLLHEYMECCFILGGKEYLEAQRPVWSAILALFEKQIPHFINALKNSNCTPDHIFALIHEMNLALKEMTEGELEAFIADIIKNRL